MDSRKCIYCNRKLTSPQSRQLGYGPECAKRHTMTMNEQNIAREVRNKSAEIIRELGLNETDGFDEFELKMICFLLSK